MDDQPLIKVRNLSFRHHGDDGEDHITKLDLDVERGSAVAVMGPFHSGRSTLCHLLTGDLRPRRGGSEIAIAGRNPWRRRSLVAHDASFITDLHSRPSWATAWFVALVMGIVYPRFNREYFFAMMERHDIDVHRRLLWLSRSQMSYLRLVMTLAANTHLIVLDESFALLDPAYRHSFHVKDLKRYMELGNSLVLVTDHPAELEKVITHVLAMRKGRRLFYEPVAALEEHYVHVVAGGEPAAKARELGPLHAHEDGGKHHMVFDRRRTDAEALAALGLTTHQMHLGRLYRIFKQARAARKE